MGLQHDRAFGGQGLLAVPVVLHHVSIDHERVVQPHPGLVADLAEAKAVPLAEGFVNRAPPVVRRVICFFTPRMTKGRTIPPQKPGKPPPSLVNFQVLAELQR